MIARKEGERKIKLQPLAVGTERRKGPTFSRKWVWKCINISDFLILGMKLYFTVFYSYYLLLLLTSAVTGYSFFYDIIILSFVW